MSRNAIAIILIASSFTSSAFAANNIIRLISKHSSTTPVVKALKMTKQTDHPYTDYSGTWMVKCDDGSGTPTVIENDANHITFNGDEFRIGQGLNGKSESNEVRTSSENISLEWNEDGSTLVIKSINFFKSHIDGSAIDTDLYKASLTMQNGQIKLDGKWITFEDVTQAEQSVPVHCVFTKKQ